MSNLEHLFAANQAWVGQVTAEDAGFFERLSKQQSPDLLWIGCSDSRVPANQIINTEPGEVFVHRNVANVVAHTDFNVLSVLQYAVDALQVKDVIVCGHYGCGGVRAAVERSRMGLIDNWIRHVVDVRAKHRDALAMLDKAEQLHALCELNVIEQVDNVCETSIVKDAWSRGQELTVHGWIYDISDGLLRDLEVSIASEAQVKSVREAALSRATTWRVIT
jgi:carbonic anhydrase